MTREKETVLVASNKQYKTWHHKCGKFGHKPNDQKCPKDKNKNMKMINMKKISIKKEVLVVCAFIVQRKITELRIVLKEKIKKMNIKKHTRLLMEKMILHYVH